MHVSCALRLSSSGAFSHRPRTGQAGLGAFRKTERLRPVRVRDFLSASGIGVISAFSSVFSSGSVIAVLLLVVFMADSKILHRKLTPAAVRRVDHEPSALAVQGDALLADLPHEVHGQPRSLVDCEP